MDSNHLNGQHVRRRPLAVLVKAVIHAGSVYHFSSLAALLPNKRIRNLVISGKSSSHRRGRLSAERWTPPSFAPAKFPLLLVAMLLISMRRYCYGGRVPLRSVEQDDDAADVVGLSIG
ncbi:hypothetical protein F5I97DRAFT_1830535 [Phlebopus sp. FC_14]|nr:hypothetical protein F5I97DRAFT_1830535 [Phlebopus sp. FC_14]